MSSSVKINVITPCFNSEHTICETLESVARQSQPHVEHLVIDGGSKDNTRQSLRSFS